MTDDPSTARDEFHVLYDAFGTYRPGHTERVIEVLNNLHAAGWQITRRDPVAGRVDGIVLTKEAMRETARLVAQRSYEGILFLSDFHFENLMRMIDSLPITEATTG